MSDRNKNKEKSSNSGALSILVSVFFFWGFIAAGNGVFIPFCKHYFHLDQFQSQLIDFSFYLAYYFGALILYFFASILKKDLIANWGYKKSIVFGLLFSAMGAIVMILAVNADSFPAMLCGLFIVALGFSLQQTAANPFATLLGTPETGAHRITLGGAINSFGTAIGPIIVSLALFGTTIANDNQVFSLGLNKVTQLYMCVGGLFVTAAVIFFFSKKLPEGKFKVDIEPSPKAFIALLLMTICLVIVFVPVFRSYITPTNNPQILETLQMERFYWLLGGLMIIVCTLLISHNMAKKQPKGWGAMQYPQLIFGMLAIFIYVGTEVTIQSNLGELLHLPDFGGYNPAQLAPFISIYWGSLMVGRWTGSIKVFEPKGRLKYILLFLIPLIAFGVVLIVNSIAQNDIKPFYGYIFCIIIQAIAFAIAQDKPGKTLTLFALLGITFMVIGLFSTGIVAQYAFLGGGLFCSVMWPCLFALSIAGLGKYTAQGSAFLIMMILGGAIIPPIQGKLADIQAIGIHQSYWVPVLGFAYLAWFGWMVRKILLKQGINYDSNNNTPN